jgi:hypothetical protein
MLEFFFVSGRALMFVEDAVSAKGPISVEVNPLSTVAELKLQVFSSPHLEVELKLKYMFSLTKPRG